MKKNLLIASLMFYGLFFSQNISLSQIVGLRGKSVANVEEYLTNKSWNYLGIDDVIVTFSYKQEEYGDKAESFINLALDEEKTTVDWISIQINDKVKYNNALNEIKSFGARLIHSKIDEDGSLVKFYQGKTTTFKLSVMKNTDSYTSVKTFYEILVLPNRDASFMIE